MSKEKYTAQEKMEIILTILKNPKKQRELLGKYDIGVSTYYKWRNRFLHGGLAGLEEYKTGPRSTNIETGKEKELKGQLKKQAERINTLATELEILKKNETWSEETSNSRDILK